MRQRHRQLNLRKRRSGHDERTRSMRRTNLQSVRRRAIFRKLAPSVTFLIEQRLRAHDDKCGGSHGLGDWPSLNGTPPAAPAQDTEGLDHRTGKSPAATGGDVIVQEATRKDNVDAEELRAFKMPTLSTRKCEILQHLREQKVTSSLRRQTRWQISQGVEGRKAKETSFKKPIAQLVRAGLLESKTGRDGGSWLTPAGESVARQLSTVGLPLSDRCRAPDG